MFFADKPYISDFFKQTVRDNNIPVVDTEISKKLELLKRTLKNTSKIHLNLLQL